MYIVYRYDTPQRTGQIGLTRNITGNSQKIWTTYIFRRKLKSSKPEFCANMSLLSEVLCRKHNIYMYLYNYSTKL